MKKQQIFICLTLSILLFFSCKKPTKNELMVEHFPKSYKIEGKILSKIKTYNPKQIIISDSLLIILNKNGDYFFQIYDTKNLDLLLEFGNLGNGPGEFTSPAFTGQKLKIEGKVYHLVYDWKKQKIWYLNFENLIKDQSIISKNETLHNEIKDTYRFVFYSDSLQIAVPDSGEELGRFKIYKNKKLDIIDYLPELPFEVHKKNLYPIYTNVSALCNSEKGIFVATPNLLGEYDFFDFSGNFLHTTIINRDEILKKAKSNILIFKEPITFYHTELKSYNSKIYSLYTAIPESIPNNSKIHVLDWNGTPIKEYLIDRALMSFAYDTYSNCFYGIDPIGEGRNNIIKYDLNNLETIK